METERHGALRVPTGEGKRLWVLGDLYELKVTGEYTGGTFTLIEAGVSPRNGVPPHVHHREDEFFYILEGELELTVDGDVSTVSTGAFAHLPKGMPHTFANVTERPARVLATIMPAGLEKFFEEIGEPATDSDLPPAGPPDFEKIMALAPEYGVEILPPPGA